MHGENTKLTDTYVGRLGPSFFCTSIGLPKYISIYSHAA